MKIEINWRIAILRQPLYRLQTDIASGDQIHHNAIRLGTSLQFVWLQRRHECGSHFIPACWGFINELYGCVFLRIYDQMRKVDICKWPQSFLYDFKKILPYPCKRHNSKISVAEQRCKGNAVIQSAQALYFRASQWHNPVTDKCTEQCNLFHLFYRSATSGCFPSSSSFPLCGLFFYQ